MSHHSQSIERKTLLIDLQDNRPAVDVHVDGKEVLATATAHPSSRANLSSKANRLHHHAAIDLKQVVLTGTLAVKPNARYLAGHLILSSVLIQFAVRPEPAMICSGSLPCPT